MSLNPTTDPNDLEWMDDQNNPQEPADFDPLVDDVEPPSKLSKILSKVKAGAKRVSEKAGDAAVIAYDAGESAGSAGKAKLKSYFGKRTPEQIQAEQDAEDARQAQKDYKEEMKYQAEIQRQPSKFEEDVSKVAKGTKTLIKKGITLSKPVVKSIVKGVGKTAITAGKAGIQAGARMGKGMAKVDEEEKASRNKTSPRSTPTSQKQQAMRPAKEPVNKPQKSYNDNFFVSGRLSKRKGGNSEFSIGESKKLKPPQKKASSGKPSKPYNDDYFVGGRKKTGGNQDDDDYFVSSKKPSQKPPKKGKGGNTRGFGLGS